MTSKEKIARLMAIPFKKRALLCFDCAEPAPHYMVHSPVWTEAWPIYSEDRFAYKAATPEGEKAFAQLCFSCLEVRLKRSLDITDFTDVLANAGIRKGLAMGRGEK